MIIRPLHPNRGVILDEVEEQRRKMNLGGKHRPSWMNHCRLALYLQIDGPCLGPPIPLIPPEGISPQSSTQTADFLVMNVKGQILPLNVPILHLLHVPDSVIPNVALWQDP